MTLSSVFEIVLFIFFSGSFFEFISAKKKFYDEVCDVFVSKFEKKMNRK